MVAFGRLPSHIWLPGRGTATTEQAAGVMRIFATNFLRELPPTADAPDPESCHATPSYARGALHAAMRTPRTVLMARHSIAPGGTHAC